MDGFSPKLLEAVQTVAQALPPPLLRQIIAELLQAPPVRGIETARAALLARLPTRPGRELLAALLEIWLSEANQLPPGALATALASASFVRASAGKEETAELVWTGPPSGVPLRQTAQALLQLINGARQELLIVSFAVYRVPEIVEALLAALERGVELRLIMESADASAGKIAYQPLFALGSEVSRRATVYYWPREQRQTDAQGRWGSLHVKCAVADNEVVLLSSANLTQYALTLNMEMGVLLIRLWTKTRLEFANQTC